MPTSESVAVVFPATPDTAAVLKETTGLDSPDLYKVLSSVPKTSAVDVYACWATKKVLEALDWKERPGRLLLRSPTGFDRGLFDIIEKHSDSWSRVKVIERGENTHAKIYVVHLSESQDLAIVGSSNATAQGFGFMGGIEQNVAVLLDRPSVRVDDPRRTFEDLWSHKEAEEFDPQKHRPTPLLDHSAWELWPYQKEALQAVRKSLDEPLKLGLKTTGERAPGALVSLPTGAGKTVIAVRWLLTDVLVQPIGAKPRRALWVVHTRDLLNQALLTYNRDRADLAPAASCLTPTMSDVEFRTALQREQMVFVTRQLLAARLPQEDVPEFDAIVIDEAHHVGRWTGDYPKILKTFPHSVRLGITATPQRSNPQETSGMWGYFKSQGSKKDGPVYWRTLRESPHSAPLLEERVGRNRQRVFATPEYRSIRLEGLPQIDIRGIKNDTELKKVRGFDGPERARFIAQQYDAVKHRPALFFAVDIADANAITGALNDRHIMAQAIHSGDSAPGCLNSTGGRFSFQARTQAVQALRDAHEQRLDAIVSVDVFIEGLDIPSIKSVFMARPTFSRRVYMQMLGRGLRGPAVGGTDTCLIVGLIDNFKRHESDPMVMTYEEANDEEAKGIEQPSSVEDEGMVVRKPLLPLPGTISIETVKSYISALDRAGFEGIDHLSHITHYSKKQIRDVLKGEDMPPELEAVLVRNPHRDWEDVEVWPAWDPGPVRFKMPSDERGLGKLLVKLEKLGVDHEAFGEACGTTWQKLEKQAKRGGALDKRLVKQLSSALVRLRSERR